jgi:hypothetical protein
MKRFITLLLVLSLFKIGTAYAATPTNTNDNSRIIFGNTKTKNANVNQVLALLVGPQGRIGPVGLTGPRGFQGINGQDGLPGAPGPAGPVGPAGATGATGPAGASGSSGPAGPAGPKGDRGDVGPAGSGGGGGSSSLAQGSFTVGACDNSITAAFTSFFSSGTFALNSIILNEVDSACSSKIVSVFFTMSVNSTGSFGPYSTSDVVKCTATIPSIPTGTSATVTIANTDPTCVNQTSAANLGNSLRKIGSRDFDSVVGLEIR